MRTTLDIVIFAYVSIALIVGLCGIRAEIIPMRNDAYNNGVYSVWDAMLILVRGTLRSLRKGFAWPIAVM